ncbi:MAG: type II toxin-antitoxin system ParD family antitoxin [Pseudomonadota bacterium]
MATMNVSLPEALKAFVEAQVETGRYANTSDYIRDLIRRDQDKAAKVAHWQKLIDEALADPRPALSLEEACEGLFDDTGVAAE